MPAQCLLASLLLAITRVLLACKEFRPDRIRLFLLMCHPDVTITLLSSENEAGMIGRANKYVIHVIIAKLDTAFSKILIPVKLDNTHFFGHNWGHHITYSKST